MIDVNNVKCSDAFLELETDLEIMDFQLWASFSSFLINYWQSRLQRNANDKLLMIISRLYPLRLMFDRIIDSIS